MLYGAWTDENGARHGGVYSGWGDFCRDTFSPLLVDLLAIEFKTHGKTYGERKESVREVAVLFSNEFHNMPMTWGELAFMNAWFSAMGKRYGLLTEFRENGIL